MYLLDSNIFIQAHRMYYPFDVVPGFWVKLIELSDKKLIHSIDKVKKEICDTSTPDDLSIWCRNDIHTDFFCDTSSCVDAYAEISLWAHSNPQYSQNAKDDFLATDLADPWLVAYAMKHGDIIVTEEVSQPLIRRKIKIPEACSHFGIRHIPMIQMFRELGETF